MASQDDDQIRNALVPTRLRWLGGAHDDPNSGLLTDGERDRVTDDLAVRQDSNAKMGLASRQVGIPRRDRGVHLSAI